MDKYIKLNFSYLDTFIGHISMCVMVSTKSIQAWLITVRALCGIIIKTESTTGFKSKTSLPEVVDDIILKQQTTASRTHSYITE